MKTLNASTFFNTENSCSLTVREIMDDIEDIIVVRLVDETLAMYELRDVDYDRIEKLTKYNGPKELKNLAGVEYMGLEEPKKKLDNIIRQVFKQKGNFNLKEVKILPA